MNATLSIAGLQWLRVYLRKSCVVLGAKCLVHAAEKLLWRAVFVELIDANEFENAVGECLLAISGDEGAAMRQLLANRAC